MPCRIIVFIGKDYFNDKKYSGPIVLGDYVEKGSVWSHKTSKSSKNCYWALHEEGLALREELVPCKEKDVINVPLVVRDRILFPPLHIKLGLIKQFTKALDKDGDCFTYLCQAFPGLTMEKLKAGIFDGPQIRQLIRDPEFENSMNEVELEAWKAFVLVVKSFLGSNEARNYAELVNSKITASETWAATWSSRCTTIFKYRPISWEPGLNEWRTAGRDSIRTWKRWRPGIRVAGTQSWWLTTTGIWRDPPCRWVFQEFEETQVQALKFEQWWNNMQFTCIYLYQCPPFSLQWSMFLSGNQYMLLAKHFFLLKTFICVDKNQLIMPQKCNRFRHKIWFFFKST